MMASIINVALPTIQATYRATIGEMQWIASAYTVLLAALTLTGGALGDRYGRRRVFQIGVVALAVASVAGSLAPTARALIAARAAQGVAAALLVPNSLALLSGAFPRAERGAAIGTWSAATSLVGAVSPMLGGWFVDAGSWRVAFATVVPVALVTFAVAARRVPDPPVMRRATPVDWPGALLATAGLFGVVSGIIAFGSGWTSAIGLGLGGAALLAFVAHERRAHAPMIPPALFGSRSFTGINALTLLLYFGVTGAFFVLPFDLVNVQHYSSTATGAAFLPFALLVGALSRRIGALGDRIGARPLLIAGATITALGLAAFALPGVGGGYATTFLAPMLLTGFGMALTVAPLTTAVLGSVAPADAGIASGVNNAVARVGTVLAVAVVGLVAVSAFGHALERGITAPGVPNDVARALASERRTFGDVAIPGSLAPAAQARAGALVERAFLVGFRGAVLFSAAVVLLGAAVAAATVAAADSTDAPEDRPIPTTCDHATGLVRVSPRTQGCEECLRTGDRWVHLRVCLTCGQVGCCDSSKNRHATEHFWTSQHPVVASLEPGETWRWCYVDEITV